jgi:hypothetical protein
MQRLPHADMPKHVRGFQGRWLSSSSQHAGCSVKTLYRLEHQVRGQTQKEYHRKVPARAR